LREWKRANPATSADQFYAKLEEVANDELKMLSLLERPRFSKKEAMGVLFDALAECTGKVTAQMTGPERRECGVMLQEIRLVSPDVTPFEIKRRARLYRTKWPTWPLTISSLCKRWSELGEGGDRTLSAKRDIYTEPVGWREVAARLFPNADFSDREWADIRVTFGAQILGAMQ
jgi:hypothetical protein